MKTKFVRFVVASIIAVVAPAVAAAFQGKDNKVDVALRRDDVAGGEQRAELEKAIAAAPAGVMKQGGLPAFRAGCGCG